MCSLSLVSQAKGSHQNLHSIMSRALYPSMTSPCPYNKSQSPGNSLQAPAIWLLLHLVFILSLWTSLVAQKVKHLSTMWETWVQSLGQEDPLEKEMAIYSSTIAWKIPWTEDSGRLQSMGLQRVGHDWVISLSFTFILSTLPLPHRTFHCFSNVLRLFSP